MVGFRRLIEISAANAKNYTTDAIRINQENKNR